MLEIIFNPATVHQREENYMVELCGGHVPSSAMLTATEHLRNRATLSVPLCVWLSCEIGPIHLHKGEKKNPLSKFVSTATIFHTFFCVSKHEQVST